MLLYFENNVVFKDVLCPHNKCHDYYDYTTLLSDLSPIDLKKKNVLIKLNLSIDSNEIYTL